MNFKRKCFLVFVILIQLFPSVTMAEKEKVFLRSGKIIEGEIVEETKELLKVDTGKGVMSIKKKYVVADDEKESDATANTRPQKKVEVYLTDWCPYCRKLEKVLKANGIEYIAYNVDLDFKAKRRLKMLSGNTGIPFTVVDGRKVYGYAPEKIIAIVNKR